MTEFTEKNSVEGFISQGVGRYLDAMVTLAAFRDSVQNKCLETLRAHLPKFSSAMGINLDPLQINLDDVPCGYGNAKWGPGWVGDSIWLQVTMDLKNVGHGLWQLAFGLLWEREGGVTKVWPYTCVVFQTKEIAKRVLEKMASSSIEDESDDYCLTIYGDPASSDTGFPQEDLEWTLNEWTDLWKKVGGVKPIR